MREDSSSERIAAQVEDALHMVDDDDVYARSGRHDRGYIDPGEAASACLEEAVQPFLDDMRQRISLGLDEQALVIAQGILLGVYHVRNNTGNAALELAPEFPVAMAWRVRNAWGRCGLSVKPARGARGARRIPIEFVEKFVPEWDWLVPKSRSRGKANRRSPGKGTRRRP